METKVEVNTCNKLDMLDSNSKERGRQESSIKDMYKMDKDTTTPTCVEQRILK